MSERLDAERLQRWRGIAGAAAVIVIPMILIAATWRPLEPLPRGQRPPITEEEQAPRRTREDQRPARDDDRSRERTPRNTRDRNGDAAPVLATPIP